jgi:hypothetical protein
MRPWRKEWCQVEGFDGWIKQTSRSPGAFKWIPSLLGRTTAEAEAEAKGTADFYLEAEIEEATEVHGEEGREAEEAAVAKGSEVGEEEEEEEAEATRTTSR